MAAVKGLDLNIGELNTLALTGETTTEDSFPGSTEIMVIENIPNIPKK